jgi:murein DD-endopeptidase MepM/ murein hydrolase activator NlpD
LEILAARGVGILIQSMLPEELNGIDELARETAVSVANLTKIIDKDLVNSFKLAAANGGTLEEGAKRLAESPALQREFILQAAAAYDGLAEVVKELSDAFKQAGEESTEFITSAIPKTPFDNLLKSTRSILGGVDKLNKSIGATDVDKLALLSEISPEYAAFLDVKAQKLIQESQLQGEIYNSLKAQVDAGKELTSFQETQLTSAKAFLESKKSEFSIITNSIQAFEETLALNQAIEITNKSRIASIQAIMSANQEAYSSGAAGERARIEREEQIRSLQVLQLQTQKAMIDASIAQAEAIVKVADAELLRLGITRDISREQVAQIEMYARSDLDKARTTAISEGFSQDYLSQANAILSEEGELSLKGLTKAQAEALKLYSITYKTFETATGISQAYEKSATTNKTITTLKLQSAALSEEIKNINQANLSAEQKSARFNAAEVRLKNEISAIEAKNASITRSTVGTQQEINDLINNTAYTARYEATRREAKALDSIADIEASRKRSVEELEASKKVAQTDYNKAVAIGLTQEARGYERLLIHIQGKIDLENESARLATEEVNLTTRKQNLEEILFDTRTRGLEIQQESLEVMRREASLARELLSKTQELRKARQEAAAARLGTERSPTAQKSEEYRSAVETYKLAVQQLTLKKLEIELEYGLLEAKRLLMEQQLLADQKRIDSEAAILREKGDTESASSLETMSAQLGKAYENIHRFNYEALKQNALKIAEMDVEILRQRAMKAYYDMVNSILPQNQANKMIQGVQDAVEIFNSLGKSDMSIEEQLAPALSPAVKAQQEQMKAQERNTQAIKENTASRLEPVTSPTIEVGGQVGDSIAQTIETSLSSLIPSGPRTSGYGKREPPTAGASANHLGLDIKLGQGTPIYAPEAGLVELSKTVGGYGKRIELNLGVLEGTSDKLTTTYSHLSRLSVQAGDRVEKGQLIGDSGGAKGTKGAGTSTGAHLHFETLINGQKVNPDETTVLKVATEANRILVPGDKNTKEAKRDIRLQREEEINAAIMSARANIDTNATAIEDRMLKMSLGIRVGIQASIDALRELGPQGAAVAAMAEGLSNITLVAAKTMGTMKQTYEDFSKEETAAAQKRAEEEGKVFDETTAGLTSKAEFRAQRMADAFASASAVIGMVASMLSASSDAKIANIDREIAAEQKRDGKSAASVAKLEAMEKKKDSIARKAFNTNKKLMMAQAVMSTAAAIASTLATAPDPVSKIILAGIIGAMGAAQIAVIAGTQYESTGGAKAASVPSTLSIGKRGDTVDLARGPSANAGGKLALSEAHKARGQTLVTSALSAPPTVGSS